ncbi:hypothetical protein A2U01_0062222, partial [Trifolium medium]|nr:hypothetical protein [Trifolium medium]
HDLCHFVAGTHFWACVVERAFSSLSELVASGRQGSPGPCFSMSFGRYCSLSED